MQHTRQTVVPAVARKFLDREKALWGGGRKGKKRDDAAVEFFVGVANGFVLGGRLDLAEAIEIALMFDVTLHGFKAVERLAGKAEEECVSTELSIEPGLTAQV